MASGSKKTDNAAEIDRLAVALAKEPGSKVFIPLAEEYGKASRWEEAVIVLEDGLKTYPSFITAMVALGRAYEQVNQPVKAQAILEEAIKVSPDNIRAHRTLAKLYAAQGARDAAIRSCNAILTVNSQDQEALALRASFDQTMVQEDVPVPNQPAVECEKAEKSQVDRPERELMSSVQGRAVQIIGSGDDCVAPTRPDVVQRAVSADDVPLVSPRGTGRSAVARLEQWLQLIQVRRRNSAGPHQTLQKTSA